MIKKENCCLPGTEWYYWIKIGSRTKDKDTEAKVKWVSLNVASNQGLAKKLNILSAPSFLVYRSGAEVERFVGDRVNYEVLFLYFQNLTGTV